MNWTLVNRALEIRYTKEFLYWDKTGLIANNLVQKFPDMDVETASPGETVLKDNDEGLTCRYSYSSAGVIHSCNYTSERAMFPLASYFFPFLLTTLGITKLTRLGNRNTYHWVCESKEDANKRFSAIVSSRRLGNDFFSQSEDERLKRKSLREFALCFGDDKTGIRIVFKQGSTTFNVNGVMPSELKRHVPPMQHLLILDVDIYTTSVMSASDLIVEDFLKSNSKLIETRIWTLLE